VKIKLDENIGSRGVALLAASGHDIMTVLDQNLQGTSDDNLLKICSDEDRVLVTLDHDFGQILRFPPEGSAGIVILEPGTQRTPRSLLSRLREFLEMAADYSPAGELWIVEPGRVRVHLRGDDT
jgi:predicted nuclease of predicted toxin-antitoxin system